MKSKLIKKRKEIQKPKHTLRELTHAFPIVIHEDGEEVIVGGISRLEYIAAQIASGTIGAYNSNLVATQAVEIAKEIIKQCDKE